MNVQLQNALFMIFIFGLFLYIGTDSMNEAFEVSGLLLLAVVALTVAIVGTITVIEYKHKIVSLLGKVLSNIFIWLFTFLILFILAKFKFPAIILVIVLFAIPIKWALKEV